MSKPFAYMIELKEMLALKRAVGFRKMFNIVSSFKLSPKLWFPMKLISLLCQPLSSSLERSSWFLVV